MILLYLLFGEMCMMSDSSQDLVPTGGNLRVMSMYANCLIFCVYASWQVQRIRELLKLLGTLNRLGYFDVGSS